MGKLKQLVQKMNGGALPDDCLSYLSYFAVFVVFMISGATIYNNSTSLLGVLLLYLVNVVYSILFAKDILSSEKANVSGAIVFVVISVLILNVASSTMIIMTFRKLHATYLKNDEKIELSDKSRNIISLYLTLWIITIVMLWVLFAFYFIEPLSSPFFDYQFIGRELSPIFMLMGFILKIVFSLSSLGISGYMVYLAKLFSDVKLKTLDT
jgi:hypothetical protein